MSVPLMREALATVALSHEDGCQCDPCKASAGDRDALVRLLVAMFDRGML